MAQLQLRIQVESASEGAEKTPVSAFQHHRLYQVMCLPFRLRKREAIQAKRDSSEALNAEPDFNALRTLANRAISPVCMDK